MPKRTIGSKQTVYLWEIYPHMIQWHQHHRRFLEGDSYESTRTHINALLILSSAIMIEGGLCSLLKFYLSGIGSPLTYGVWTNDPIAETNLRLRKKIEKEIERSSWRDLKESLFQSVTGLSLSSFGQDYWEPVIRLFEFRNLLLHGEEINIEGDWIAGNGIELQNVKRNTNQLFEFLEKGGFLNRPSVKNSLGWELLKDDIADYFVEQGRQFFTCVLRNCPDSDYEHSLPKRMKEVMEATKKPGPEFDEPLYTKRKTT